MTSSSSDPREGGEGWLRPGDDRRWSDFSIVAAESNPFGKSSGEESTGSIALLMVDDQGKQAHAKVVEWLQATYFQLRRDPDGDTVLFAGDKEWRLPGEASRNNATEYNRVELVPVGSSNAASWG